MHYRSLFSAYRFSHYAHRMVAWLHGDRLRQAIQDGHGKVTPMMWNFTVFDGETPFDNDIRDLMAMEESFDEIPTWAIDIAVQIDALPHCGHIDFPTPIYAICRGIGKEQADPGFMFCFEVRSATKDRVKRYAEVLEGWTQGRTQDQALTEWPDIQAFTQTAYTSLGSLTEIKRLQVEQLVLYFRLSMEELTTHDGSVLTIQTDTHHAKAVEEAHKQRLRKAALDEDFDVDAFLMEMDHPWLCHQRLFDQIDVILQRIGREETYDHQQACRDAQSTADQMRRIYDVCIDSLGLWLIGGHPEATWRDDPEVAQILAHTYDVLGEQTPVKIWLTTAFRKKVSLFQQDDLEDSLAV